VGFSEEFPGFPEISPDFGKTQFSQFVEFPEKSQYFVEDTHGPDRK